MPTDKQTQPVVTSIGLEGSKTVLRLFMPDRSWVYVAINYVNFAELAAKGIPVVNAR